MDRRPTAFEYVSLYVSLYIPQSYVTKRIFAARHYSDYVFQDTLERLNCQENGKFLLLLVPSLATHSSSLFCLYNIELFENFERSFKQRWIVIAISREKSEDYTERRRYLRSYAGNNIATLLKRLIYVQLVTAIVLVWHVSCSHDNASVVCNSALLSVATSFPHTNAANADNLRFSDCFL
jgi:hypothetical protein